jgi:hypothetical protein
MRKSASDPIGTLSVGNVVNAAISLYKSNFRDYFAVSLRSVGWLVLAIVGIIPIALLAGAFNNIGLTVLAVVVWLALLVFCLAKYATNRGIISRLAYQQLIHEPETVSSATMELANSHWKFLGLILWLGLFYFAALMVTYLVLILSIGLGIFLGTQMPNPIGYTLAAIIITAGVLGAIWLLMRFYSYFFIAELPIAVENAPGGLDSIGRSRQLSTPFISRILVIILIAFLITLPLNIVANVPSFAAIGQVNSNPTAYAALQIFSTVLSLLLELFLVPFWQAIKSVIYFDLRSRREGNDLQMR